MQRHFDGDSPFRGSTNSGSASLLGHFFGWYARVSVRLANSCASVCDIEEGAMVKDG